MFIIDLCDNQSATSREKIKIEFDEKTNCREFKRRVLVYMLKKREIIKIAKNATKMILK